jgi:hypothetical protein
LTKPENYSGLRRMALTATGRCSRSSRNQPDFLFGPFFATTRSPPRRASAERYLKATAIQSKSAWLPARQSRETLISSAIKINVDERKWGGCNRILKPSPLIACVFPHLDGPYHATSNTDRYTI